MLLALEPKQGPRNSSGVHRLHLDIFYFTRTVAEVLLGLALLLP